MKIIEHILIFFVYWTCMLFYPIYRAIEKRAKENEPEYWYNFVISWFFMLYGILYTFKI